MDVLLNPIDRLKEVGGSLWTAIGFSIASSIPRKPIRIEFWVLILNSNLGIFRAQAGTQ
jgi:hypothetical protein